MEDNIYERIGVAAARLEAANQHQLKECAAFIALKAEPEWNDDSHQLQLVGALMLASGGTPVFVDYTGAERQFRHADLHDSVLEFYCAFKEWIASERIYYDLWHSVPKGLLRSRSDQLDLQQGEAEAAAAYAAYERGDLKSPFDSPWLKDH